VVHVSFQPVPVGRAVVPQNLVSQDRRQNGKAPLVVRLVVKPLDAGADKLLHPDLEDHAVPGPLVNEQAGLQEKLAPMLLVGDFKEGDTIRVDADEKVLTFKTQE
jgi:hypothetical protein